MKAIFLFLLIPLFAFSQQEELYYYIGKDSLVGIKNNKGEIIIPADFDDARFRGLEEGQKVEKGFIFFMFHKDKTKKSPQSAGFVYDRKGNFMFEPYLFDNGMDYFSQGLMRFVQNGKVGFVNKKGKVKIPAIHDYATPFENGYSDFCDGCTEKCVTEDNCEHKIMVGGKWGKMNKRGKVVQAK